MRTSIALLLVLVAAGCGGGSGTDVTGGTGSTGGTTSAPAEKVDAEVFASEYAFAPPFVIFDKAGTYTLSLRNDGNVPHNLTIKGQGGTPNVQPGETATVTVTLKAGQYEMVCTIGDHAEQGMDGTLTVH
jgi:plastocyanin